MRVFSSSLPGVRWLLLGRLTVLFSRSLFRFLYSCKGFGFSVICYCSFWCLIARASWLWLIVMERDKHRNQKTRRRERAQRMQAEKRQTQNSKSKDCDSAEDDLPLKEKPKRPPPPSRRKKTTNNNNNSSDRNLSQSNAKEESLFEEDIIDGFAIFSFASYDDLEVRYIFHILSW